jgi:hypothetical protein
MLFIYLSIIIATIWIGNYAIEHYGYKPDSACYNWKYIPICLTMGIICFVFFMKSLASILPLH